MTVKKKSTLVALGPLQTLSLRLNKWIQLAAVHRQLQGRRSRDLGPTATWRSVVCQHTPYFNPSWSLRKFERAVTTNVVRKVLVKSSSAAGAAFFLEKRVCLLILFVIRTGVRGTGGQSTHQGLIIYCSL